MRRVLPEPVVRMTQFYRPVDGGEQYHGTCGQTALAVCLAAARGEPADFGGVGELMIALTRAMIAAGLAAPNGASTLAALATQARTAGGIVTREIRYREPELADWRAILAVEAGARPILLQVARGEALVDVETGRGDEPGLRYHAIALVGVDAAGYLAVDGDHPEVTRRFQVYDETTLARADPCGLLVLDMRR